ncbi:DUF1802 family protein [Candidatus Lucifugimonas marina]|jgi:hypothetical protein|uniref:DUF1802 family protein n=1 Tax=Candidatus Lucifugimonas marina TaxID=3038979 RepID=A0AAJ5ZDL5_9CHLR|nr:DUF1802 family protein [SAR202 cluster bacterium JH702]MDG0868420.1 DUF1802 family protein [SAR202 cluster bacterium JH639]WFG35053.1 DUF1802 family protein [SAR202 cluster bacterium JH545]WFG39010.1 DUF1802 family protein [SAR202 cluster bacterium JH1073]
MLPNSSNIGLKEWAVTTGALGRGEQIFMLRKGGIREDGRHFKIEHEQFLLYPGVFHEGELLLKQEKQNLLEETANADFSKEIPFSVYCELVETIEISEEHHVRALDAFHIWSKEFPVKRFNWKPRHPLKLMIVRAHKLDSSVTVNVDETYGGCKSWVDLTDEIDITNLTPALSDAEFEAQVSKIHEALKAEPVNA